MGDPKNLAWRALAGLKRNLNRVVVVDRTGYRRKTLRAGRLLATAAALAGLTCEIKEVRVGILLPPGIGCWITNLAVALAGKSSVNLNFTASTPAIQKMINASGINTIISARAMRERLSEFPWTREVWNLEEILKSPGMKSKVLKKFVQAHWLSTAALAKKWGIKEFVEEEATLLFSSGSTGIPKGVPLTHENIGANIDQIAAIGLLPRQTRLLACLPIFHSFGLTVTLWYPLCHPLTVITSPNPIDAPAIARAVKKERANVLMGTASFFRLYLREVRKSDFLTLKSVIAGAEKTPRGLHEKWEATFGSRYLEGYGLTETSPVVSVNLPHDNRVGTVGYPLKGILARVVDIATREVLSKAGERGVIELKGKNIFSGYLDEPKLNSEIFHDGWFWTGDVGSITPEGRLVIEGRLRRFSKIAGEMVPHGAVEEAIAAVYGWHEGSQIPLAVTGVFDEKKGECLVAISEQAIDMADLRSRLQKHGLPNLWIPKKIIVVDALPHLPSGKLDLQKLVEMAMNS